MDGLRWLLLFFGLVVIAAVYLYSRTERKKGQPEEPLPGAAPERLEPTFDDEEPRLDTGEAEAAEADIAEEPPAPEARKEQKIVTLRLVARGHRTFAGDELLLGLRGAGMRHGKFGIFHYYADDDEKKIVFSAASLVEPGSFDIANIKSQNIPGISIFMVLPGPMDGAQAFDLMMHAGRELATSLDAELLDESGSTLSIQRERYLREEIIQFMHGIKVA